MSKPLTIIRVTALPAQPEANTLYFLKKADSLVELHVSNSDGTELRHLSTQQETLSQTVIFSDVAPELPCASKLWWNTVDGVLYVQYDDGTTVTWVEASPAAAIPEFGGTGSSNLMARADHNHDSEYVRISNINEW